MKKAYTLIELLAVIVILAVISAIAYPNIINVIGSSKLKAYDISKKNIIESAKLKYVADVNSALVTEYKVVDLIDDGYINKDAKNPLTNDNYDEKTKILITNENGTITYDYIEGDTLYDLVSLKNDKDGVYKDKNNYIYKGIDAKNYLSFNQEIYRIIMIDQYRNIYLLKEISDKNINKDEINQYINSYYNDNYGENIKKNILNTQILNYDMYKNSFINGESYIINNNDIWINDNNNNKVLSYVTNNFNDNIIAKVRLVLKLKNNIVISNGSGTQLDPYISVE